MVGNGKNPLNSICCLVDKNLLFSVIGIKMEKAFTLNFLTDNPEIDFNQEWTWKPEKAMTGLEIKTATFSGKNQADDYTNE